MWNFLNVKEWMFGFRNQNCVLSQWMSLLWMVTIYSCSCVSCAPSRWLIKASVSTSSSSRGLCRYSAESRGNTYLQLSLRCFTGSCEWASSELSERHRLSFSVKTFLTSTVVLCLGHSPQERTITNEISLKSRLFLPDSASVIWRAYGKR